jgi:hypothetical protein
MNALTLREHELQVEFEVLTVVVIFWDITPYSPFRRKMSPSFSGSKNKSKKKPA